MRAEIRRDAWGIPHLRAGGPRALAYLQGQNAARDRAWQIEVERHRAAGTSAAFLGARGADWDVFARQAMIEDTARRCHARLDPDTADWVAAYVAGVNAELGEGAGRAPEFTAAGLAPGRWRPWTPLALWLSTHILFAGFPTKLWRDLVRRTLGPAAVALFRTDGPAAGGSNGWLLAGERTASGAALLAGDPHRFIEAPGVYQQIRLSCPDYDVIGLAVPGVPGIAHFGHTGHVAWAITSAMADYQDLYRERLRRRGGAVEALGPDGWARAASRTETVEVAGHEPIRVEVVETARGPLIAGAAPSPPTGGTERGAARRAGADVRAEPAVGAHPAAGPEDQDTWEGVSLRCPVRVSGEIGFAALPALLAARTVGDVDRALDGWTEPVNVVQAADTRGGLLHRVAGRVPVRDPANRVRVVPAWDPRHAWAPGYAPLPRAPVRDGYAVMANERGLAAPLGVEFAAPHRARRIAALLAGSRAWTADDMAAIHTDTYTAGADVLLECLAALGPADDPGRGDGAGRADGPGPADGPARGGGPPGPGGALGPADLALRDRLLRWDRRMDPDSTGAAAYALLRAAVVGRLAAHPALAPLAAPPPYPEVFRPWLALLPRVGFALETLLTRGPVPAADRADILRAALREVAAGPRRPPGGNCTGSTPGPRRPARRRPRPGSAGTTTACSPRPACPASPTRAHAAPPPASCGTWRTGRAAAGWCRSAP
ncbi:penicillin amidase, partial [Streptomyces sp. DvalAA-14]